MGLAASAFDRTRGKDEGVVGVRSFVDDQRGEVLSCDGKRGEFLGGGGCGCGRGVGERVDTNEIVLCGGVFVEGDSCGGLLFKFETEFRGGGGYQGLDFGEWDLEGG